MHKCTEITLSGSSKNKCAQEEVDNKVVTAVKDFRGQRYWGWRKGVCCPSVSKSCLTHCDPMTAARQASLPITNSRSLLKLMAIDSLMPSNHLILCHPFLLLPSIFPSIGVFSSELVFCLRWPKYYSFSISLSMNLQNWFILGWTGWISLKSAGLSRVFSNTTVGKHPFLGTLAFFRKERCLQS